LLFYFSSDISLYIHYVFSTKERQPLLVPEIQDRVWAYMGGIARKNQMKALSIGGTKFPGDKSPGYSRMSLRDKEIRRFIFFVP
jgi:hypothetical protein